MKRNDIKRILISVIILLFALIFDVKNPRFFLSLTSLKESLNRQINFLHISSYYNGFLHQLFDQESEEVGLEMLNISLEKEYENGYIVSTNIEPVFCITSGVVVCVGNQNISVMHDNGDIYYYKFLDGTNAKMYEYVYAGDVIGSCNGKYYLSIYNNEYLDLKEVFYENKNS